MDELHIPKQLVERHADGFIMWYGVIDDFVERRDGLLGDIPQHVDFFGLDLLAVVVVDLDQPELLQSRLLLHFALKHAVLRCDAERGLDGLRLVFGLLLGRTLVRLRTLFYLSAFVLRVPGLRLLLRVAFLFPCFHRFIKLLAIRIAIMNCLSFPPFPSPPQILLIRSLPHSIPCPTRLSITSHHYNIIYRIDEDIFQTNPPVRLGFLYAVCSLCQAIKSFGFFGSVSER